MSYAEPLLLAALIAAPCLAGGVHPSTTAFVAVLGLAALWGWAVGPLRRDNPRRGPEVLGIGLLALLAWQGFTLLPLPAAWVAGLAPASFEALDVPLMEGLASPRITVSPGATALECVELAGLLAVYLVAGQVARSEAGARRLTAYVAMAAGVVMVLSLAQTATGTQQVLWTYTPISTTQLGLGSHWGFRTTFVNPNHAAQFLALGGLAAFVAGGLDRSRWRWAGLAVGGACLAGVVATGSHGGLVAAGLGAAFGLCLIAAGRWPRLSALRWPVPIASLALVGATLALARGGDGSSTMDALEDTALASRLELKTGAWSGAARMARAHRWTGAGRGAFRDAFPLHQQRWTGGSASHAENEYLQLFAELGTPWGVALLALVLVTWSTALARWRGSPWTAGALAGTLALGVHAVVEFGTQFPGVSWSAAVLLGLCGAAAWTPHRRAGKLARIALAAVPTTALALTPAALRYGDHSSLVQRVLAASPEQESTVVHRALHWRPQSADVSLAVAGYHARQGDPIQSLYWLSRTMYLAPADPTPHVIAARTLASVGKRGQALAELRDALARETERREPLFALLAQLAENRADVDRAVGEDVEVIAGFASYLVRRDGSSPLGQALVDELRAVASPSPAAILAIAEAERAGGDPGGAAGTLRDYLALHPDDVSVTCALAAALRQAGDLGGAGAVIESALATRPEQLAYWLESVRIQLAAGRPAAARRDLRKARSCVAPGAPDALARVQLADAELRLEEGDLAGARDAFVETLRLCPDWHDARLKLGRVYREMGRRDAALREFRRVRRGTDAYPFLDGWIGDLELTTPDGDDPPRRGDGG